MILWSRYSWLNPSLIGGLEHFLLFPYIGNSNPNWLFFSEGLKPPTRSFFFNTPNVIYFFMILFCIPCVVGSLEYSPCLGPLFSFYQAEFSTCFAFTWIYPIPILNFISYHNTDYLSLKLIFNILGLHPIISHIRCISAFCLPLISISKLYHIISSLP